MCTIYQFEKWVTLCNVNKLLACEKFNKQVTIYKQVTIETIWLNNQGYLVNKNDKMFTKRGHFSDRKFQNGYKNRLGCYTKQHHNPVLNY